MVVSVDVVVPVSVVVSLLVVVLVSVVELVAVVSFPDVETLMSAAIKKPSNAIVNPDDHPGSGGWRPAGSLSTTPEMDSNAESRSTDCWLTFPRCPPSPAAAPAVSTDWAATTAFVASRSSFAAARSSTALPVLARNCRPDGSRVPRQSLYTYAHATLARKGQ